MKIYRENLKVAATVFIILTAVVAFFFYFRTTLYELFRINWALTIGETREVCTPEDRLAYLEAHPGEIKFAMLGDWQIDNKSGKPNQNVLGMAIRRINSDGGINGRRIIPEWMDTRGSMNELREYVEKIAYDPSYYMIFGPSTSGQLLDIKPLLLNYKLLTIAPRLSNPGLTVPEDPPYIFLPCSSDIQEIEELRKWAQNKNLNNFILINENKIFAEGYSKHLERMFFESDRVIIARTHFNKTDNVRYLLEELGNYITYLDIQNALVVNVSPDPEKNAWLTRWLLTNVKGSIFSYKIMPGKYTDEELQRMYTIVYFDEPEDLQEYVSELSLVPAALSDSYAPRVYRSVFLLADAFRQAESLHQRDVIKVMLHNTLDTPFGKFRFNKARFEESPEIRAISIYQLRKEWDAMLETCKMKKRITVSQSPKKPAREKK